MWFLAGHFVNRLRYTIANGILQRGKFEPSSLPLLGTVVAATVVLQGNWDQMECTHEY